MMRTNLRTLAVTALALTLLAALPAAAQRGDDTNRTSKNGKTEGVIDGVSFTLEYGRPSVRGRDVFGALVPYGNVWRTGADEATTITFAQDVAVEGQPLAAGTYSLFTIPGEGEWTVIFNKTATQWGAFNYDSAEDALRVQVAPRAVEHVEAMDFIVEGDEVVLRWAELGVPFKVAGR